MTVPAGLATHRVVMDTLRVQLGLTRGPTFLISIIIPQAHLLLMSLTYRKLELYLSRIKKIGNIYCFVGTGCYE